MSDPKPISMPFLIRTKISEIEKMMADLVGPLVEEFRKDGGNSLADEVLCSIAALFSARAVGIIHVWSGESLDKIEQRFLSAFRKNLLPTIEHLNRQTIAIKNKGKID